LINYEKLRTCPRLALAYWFGVILDESTKIRNPKAQITKVCLAGFGNATYRLILSGLPAPESLLDFYCQMSFLKPEWMACRNYWEFRQRYFHLSYYDWLPDLGTAETVRLNVADDAYWLRRKDVNMGGQKVYERRYVEPSALQKTLQKQAKKEWELEGKQATNILQVMTWLSQLAGGFHPETTDCISNAKTEALLELLQGELRGESVVVWFRFLREMDWVQMSLLGKGIVPSRIDGSQTFENRSRILEDFNLGKTKVLLVQEKCGKFGLNLSRSQTAIYYSNDWSLEDRMQSEDRIVGFSQEPLLILDLVTEGTLDEKLLSALLQKKQSANEFSSRIRELVLEFLAERS
jgi:SNF2 family DNA or RNA helicase